MGLGLAISRGLVELHGGTIALASRPGEGARFTFDLQSTGEAAQETPETPVAQLQPLSVIPSNLPDADMRLREPELFAPGDFDRVQGGALLDIRTPAEVTGLEEQTYRALIVDDDPVNLQVLKNYMQLEGFSVLLAHNGQEAIDFIEKGYEPDIVLLDVMMPRMSGYEVCAKIRETHPAARLPVVMLTAKNQIEDLRAGFDSGASDYLAKPFSREELSAQYGIRIAVSEQVIKAIENRDQYPHRKLDVVQVVGKKKPVSVYEIFAADEPESVELKLKTRDTFEAASVAFQQGKFETALAAFRDVLSLNPGDAAALHMADRTERFIESGAPRDWAGIEVLQRK